MSKDGIFIWQDSCLVVIEDKNIFKIDVKVKNVLVGRVSLVELGFIISLVKRSTSI